MSSVNADLIGDLQARGLIAQVTAESELFTHLATGSRTLYCGFDPTADSLHLGHLVPLLVLARFQQAGHKPIALVGGATGLIGDPSFKAAERQLNTPEVVAGWSDRIRGQVSRFLRFEGVPNPATVVNNLEWTGELKVLDFLRDVGKHFSVSNMISKESVQQRLHRDGAGISFTEFSYALLQGMDFAELCRRYDCTIQVGGSDQWGNIVGGIDLCRRQNQRQGFGLTVPLVTKADGTKFGKTEAGAVWLDAAKTSPYSFYQFWLAVADADVYNFMRFFTFMAVAEIACIEAEDRASGQRPEAQRILAREMTRLIHGDEGLAAAERITEAMFGGSIVDLTEADLEQLALDGMPTTRLDVGQLTDKPLTTLLTESGMTRAGREVKDALVRNAVFINEVGKGTQDNLKAAECFAQENALFGRFFVVRLGKKKNHLFVLG